jgi:hypothetical protein
MTIALRRGITMMDDDPITYRGLCQGYDDAAKKVVVSSAQKRAAPAMVKRAAATGRQVSKAVHKIANAKKVGR